VFKVQRSRFKRKRWCIDWGCGLLVRCSRFKDQGSRGNGGLNWQRKVILFNVVQGGSRWFKVVQGGSRLLRATAVFNIVERLSVNCLSTVLGKKL
jgi:hypothetical protein